MKIKCRLCEKEYGVKQFGMHVSRTHKIPYQEYAQKYWEDLPNWSPCTECGTVCKSTYCSDECYKSGQLKFLKNREVKPFTEEHKKKMSKSAKKRLKDKTKHPMFGKNHSSETIEKMSKAQSEYLKQNGHWATGTTLSEETKQKISETRIEREVAKGKNNPMFGKTHSPESIKKIFKHRKMNKLEKRVADYLDENDVDYTFQFFITEDGICKSYDFKFGNYILEVHGDYWHGGKGVKNHVHNVDEVIENDKLKKQIAEQRGYEVIYVWQHEIEKLDNLISPYL